MIGPAIRCAHACLGATLMQCLGCGAKMLLMEVVPDDTSKVSGFECRIFKCSVCPQIARRFVFSRVKMPVTHLPVITTPTHNLWKGVAAPSAWGKAIETLRSRQTDLKERAAAAKTAGGTKAVEKVRSRQAALVERAAVASRLKPAEPLQAPGATSSGPPASPTVPSEPVAFQSAWERAVAKIRARQDRAEAPKSE